MDELLIPRRVLLFTGHCVDSSDRPLPRFPGAKVAAAIAAIDARLDALTVSAADLGFTQGAAGGDLIFAEACVERAVRLQLILPLPESEFIRCSLLPSTNGEQWAERYRKVRARCATPPLTLPEDPGVDPRDATVFERCNLWLLESALAWGAEKLTLICLWDGGGGDGPGGTAHMVHEVKRRGGHVIWIDTRLL